MDHGCGQPPHTLGITYRVDLDDLAVCDGERELKGAQMIDCEFCVDLGSQICRSSGLTDEELLALPNYRSSELFSDREKTALDYTVAVMRTPVEVTDELFARMREHFAERQLVEITARPTLVNLDRFNAAFGVGSAGSAEGGSAWFPTVQSRRSSSRRTPSWQLPYPEEPLLG